MIISFGVPLTILISLPIIACVVCIVIDTWMQYKYYKWNKEIRASEQENQEDEG